ncbi:dickkopf-related protein 3a [Odontesthes bonariensis]|uniref:dickkopf-related protein 3a n=1 Tax=Odontesthes bonariensis TaxID=219752 RepID=UPI003F58E0B4
MMRSALLVLALTAVSNGILPEIVDSGINHILEGKPYLDRMFVEVEQLPEDPQQKPEDAFPQETNNITTADQAGDLGNNIDHGCMTDGDCGKGRYCSSGTRNSKCQPCKETDVSCTKDVECCGHQLCVWGQCSQNATKGEAGSTCQYQTDCSPDLCCALHKTLLFAVCSSKPIEREQCFGDSNHLMELLSWDTQDEGPRKHCPCAGDLHCQHLGRGSMCLKGEDSSEEDLTDSLYSVIDYIL